MRETEKNFNSLEAANIESLPASLVRKGYEYRLVWRTKKVCCYKAVDIDSGKVHGYEVFIVKVSNKIIFDSNGGRSKCLDRFKEYYPHDEAFGKTAWFFNRPEDAMKKYNYLNGGVYVL